MIDQIALSYILSNENLLMEDRMDYLRNNTPKLSTAHDVTAFHQDTPSIINHFAENADPSTNKKYTQYILGLYRKGLVRQEDAPRIKGAIGSFDQYQHKLPVEDRQLSLKKYPNLSSIEEKMQPHLGTLSKTQAKTDLDQPGHELKYEDDKIKVYKLTSEKASRNLYGGGHMRGGLGTSWCTAADSDNNMFDHYHEQGPLQVIHRKSDGAVFQAHAVGNQFMNAKDEEISKDDLLSLAPGIHTAWKLHPDLLTHPD
jgi:hypothetical protein